MLAQQPCATPKEEQLGSEALYSSPRRPRVLLAVSGSVATIKLPELAQLLLEFSEVKVVVTKASHYFFKQEQLPPACHDVLGDVPFSLFFVTG